VDQAEGDVQPAPHPARVVADDPARRVVDADEALRLGLVSRVFDAGSFADEVQAVAAGIAGNAPIATRYTKVALNTGFTDLDACLQWEALAQPATLTTEDLQEGIRAATEKRAPEFRGR
jgi:enoyl-CoA hydratase